jgi:hypothetical protein
MSGPLFARQLLRYTQKEGPALRIVIFDQTDCNYCAGLMTSAAREALTELCDLTVPEEIILTKIDGFAYVNAAGSTTIAVEEPLVSMLRTDRFGEAGFDDALKYHLLSRLDKENRGRLEIIEPVTVSALQLPTATQKGWVNYRLQGERRRLEAEVIVLACGLRSLDRPMMNDFIAQSGYTPPRMMEAGVAEVDATKARYNHIGGHALIVDNIIPGCIVGIIPKRPNWITVSALNRRIAPEDLDLLFSHPALRHWIDLPQASNSLRCRTTCPARVYTTPAKNFSGDGWLAVGDLTGYGRMLKDGYLACINKGANQRLRASLSLKRKSELAVRLSAAEKAFARGAS